MGIEPHLGALVSAQARFQLNLIVRKDPGFPPLANLSDSTTVIPIFWVQEGYNDLPSSTLQKLSIALMLPNIFSDGIIIIPVIIGVLLIIWPLLKGARSILSEQQMYKYNFNQTPVVTTCTNSNNICNSTTSNNKLKTYNPLPYEDDSEF